MPTVATQPSLFDTKLCSLCGYDLPLGLFMPRSDAPGKYHAGCRPCRAAAVKARYVPHPPVTTATATEWTCRDCKQKLPIEQFPRRGDSMVLRRTQCLDCKRAENRRYKNENREMVREAARREWQEKPDQVRARLMRNREAHPERYAEMHRDWKQRNPDACRATAHKRHARVRHNGGSWTADDWLRLKARFDWHCLMCGRQEMTDGITLCFDHVVPLALGGFNIISNAQPLCRSCNSKKHTKVLDLRPQFIGGER